MGGFWFEFLRRVSQRGKQEKCAQTDDSFERIFVFTEGANF